MATFTKKLSGDSRYSITLTVNETSTSITNNTSTITYSLTATKSSGSGYYSNSTTNPVKITINGEVLVNKKVSYNFTGSTPKTITLASGTRIIQHEEDGTKTIQCSGYFKDASNSLGSATASGSLTLTQLHKAPNPYITSITEQNSLLYNMGITDDIVANLSIKQFTFGANIFDEATLITQTTIKNGTTTATTFTDTASLNFITNSLYIENDKAPIEVQMKDDLNAVGTSTYTLNVIPYFKPTLVESGLTTKRDGQLTGKVKLKANGTYYEQINNTSITPKILYSIKERGGSSYILQNQELTPTYSNGNWQIDANIGTDDTSATSPTSANPLFYFNPSNSYEIEIQVIDVIINTSTRLSNIYTTYKAIVLQGEATWTEYKDRVDFKKITVQNQPVLMPYVLYDDSTGSMSNIQLSDSVANYQFLEIYYYYDSTPSWGYCCAKVEEPDGKDVLLKYIIDNNGYLYINRELVNLSTNQLTRTSAVRWRIATGGGNSTRTVDSDLAIYKVIGYK